MKLVAIPGLDGTGALLRPFIAATGDDFDIQIITLSPDGDQCQTKLADQIAHQLPTQEPFFLLGESFGGRIAYELARKQPSGLKGLIYVASFLSPPRRGLLGPAAALPLPALVQAPLFGAIARRILFGRHASDTQWQNFQATIASLPPGLLTARLRALKQSAEPDTALSLPCLQLRAKDDLLMDAEADASIWACARHLQTLDINGPHFLLQTQPEACAEAITDFMQSAR